ncbi:adhesion G protein-coupled receptor E1-like isoform X1 [Macrobrachium rosenbergii]|uniref:adhesion G protein-coupled receptor E1-like isoform X1 n=1 Tax=Macrobrachium rosenbergii TaxID=79674 RepID=UPI0034D74E57
MKIQIVVFSSILTWVHFAHCQSEVEVLITEVRLLKNDALNGMQALQQKQNDILEKLQGYEELLQKIPEIQKKLDHVENNLQELHRDLEHMKGAVNNNQDSLQNFHHELEHVKGGLKSNQDSLQRIHQEIKDCLGREDLESFKNISSAGQQELESSLRQEISGVISLLETGGIDECSEGSHNCGDHEACTDKFVNFTCSCLPGFARNGLRCEDMDECARGKAECSPQAACRNSVGSYSCSCNPPFEGDGRTCCPPGFAQNGSHCDDMDECARGKAECNPHAACRNSVGSYSCSCNPPFQGDGRTCCPPGFAQNGSNCDDMDECARGKAECSPHAACRNSVGSYSCSCNPPFQGDGRTCCPPGFAQNGSNCDDMDECAQGTAECSPQAACRNSVGSYSCSCNPPFEGDGRTCGFSCKSPAKVLEGVGCVKPVLEEKTWQEMKATCQEAGGRLLQDFSLTSLQEVGSVTDYYGLFPWVGVYEGKWLEKGSPLEKRLWLEGYRAGSSRRCGSIDWDSSSSLYKVSQIDCSEKSWGLCQIQLV